MEVVRQFAFLTAYTGGLFVAGWITGREPPTLLNLTAINAIGAAGTLAVLLLIRFGWPRVQAWRNRGKGWPDHMIEDLKKGEPKCPN